MSAGRLNKKLRKLKLLLLKKVRRKKQIPLYPRGEGAG